MKEVFELYRQGRICEVQPVIIFDVSELANAYNYVSADTNISKVAVSLENRKAIIKVYSFLIF